MKVIDNCCLKNDKSLENIAVKRNLYHEPIESFMFELWKCIHNKGGGFSFCTITKKMLAPTRVSPRY